MAKKFLTPVRFPTLTSDPRGSGLGDMYFNSISRRIRYYDGSAWSDLTSSGGGGGSSNALEVLDTAPTSPVTGQIYFDSQERTIKTFNGNIWYDVAGPKEILDHDHGQDGKVLHVDYETYVQDNNVYLDGGTSATTNFLDIIDGGYS